MIETLLNFITTSRRGCKSLIFPLGCRANWEYQIVCARAGFYLDENLGYSDLGSDGSGFDLSVWRKGFKAPGPQSMYFI